MKDEKKFFYFIKPLAGFSLLLGLLSSCMWEPPYPNFIHAKDSCNFSVNQYSGQGLRWRKDQFPIVFYVHKSVSPEAEKNFISATEHWNMAWANFLEEEGITPFDLLKVDNTYLRTGSPKRDGENVIYFLGKDFSNYDTNTNPKKIVQAITAMYSTNTRIKDTDILINNLGLNRFNERGLSYYYDEDYDREVRMAKNKTQSYRNLAQAISPNLWSQILNRLQSFFKFFVKPFTKKEIFREISSFAEIPKDKIDFPSLVIHEQGHSLGGGHCEDDPGEDCDKENNSESDSQNLHSEGRISNRRRAPSHISVMETDLLKGVNRRQITRYDLKNLFCAYINW